MIRPKLGEKIMFGLCITCLIVGSTLAATARAQESPRELLDFIDARAGQTIEIAGALWNFAEVGYKEVRSSKLLQDTLAAEGFEIDSAVAGIPTAFVASYGSGEPVIGVLAEFDALPGITQDAVAVRSPLPGKPAAHACGHNLFGAGSVGAAIAIRHWLEETGTEGTVRLYGTPAEEGGSGKVYMVRAGLFDDVDAVLHWHPSDHNSAGVTTNLANRSAKFRFRGVSAHAAGAPDRGRSALDGVEALDFMTNMMREHVPQETRIHYVITSGGSAPNVVPDFAEVYYYLRHPDADVVNEIWDRILDAARGAALGTGTQVDWEIVGGTHALLNNLTLAEMIDEKLRAVGGVDYSAEEREFAEKIYATFDSTRELGSEAEIEPFEEEIVPTSTDVGDVSIAVPTVGIAVATWVPGTAAHSWQAVAASGMSIGHKGAIVAAKTLSLAAIELFTNEDLLAEAATEHRRNLGDDFVYESMLGDRAPALDYRD
jgi:aminobenzoyl-glutamate utilization protein B